MVSKTIFFFFNKKFCERRWLEGAMAPPSPPCSSLATKLHQVSEKDIYILTPTDVTKLQTAHFTDRAPYWYINSILQLPQLTCATWFAVKNVHLMFPPISSYSILRDYMNIIWSFKRLYGEDERRLNLVKLFVKSIVACIPSKARLTVWQQEHCTLVAPRMYMSKVWQPPQTNWAISVPVNEFIESEC